MDRDTLERSSKNDLITLMLSQTALIAALTERIAILETKLRQPSKMPNIPSMPPSRGRKPNWAERRAMKPKGRPAASGR